MSDDNADPGRQRTVAELLAQHGGGAASGSRRRRRAAEDDEPASESSRPTRTGSSSAASPVESSGGVGRSRSRSDDTASTRAGRTGATGSVDPQPSRTSSYPATPPPQVPEQRWAGHNGYGQSIDPLTGEPVDLTDRVDRAPGQTQGAGSRGTGSATGSYRSMPLTRTDPPTEELTLRPEGGWASRVKDSRAASGPATGPVGGYATGGGPLTGQVSRAELFDEDDDDEVDGHDDDLDEEDDGWGRRASAAPAGLAERDERGELPDEDDLEVEERPGGLLGWLGLVAQWAAGAVVGALLWVGFSYLWMHTPVVALIAAVVATGVLVLVVRAIRRSDDLQTTMLAVLVGVVVTISPAVLLLAAR